MIYKTVVLLIKEENTCDCVQHHMLVGNNFFWLCLNIFTLTINNNKIVSYDHGPECFLPLSIHS